MPRSTKATARASIAPKRTSKRSASQQKDVYAIPESPEASDASRIQNASSCAHEIDVASSRSSSPAPTRGRSMSTVSTRIDDDSTPTQAKPIRSRTSSLEPKQFHLPGFEALEAVNGLYQKLKDGQDENERLRQENLDLLKQMHEQQKQIRDFRAELQAEQEKTRAFHVARDKIIQAAHIIAEDNLNTVLTSLRNFSTAAFNLMPLLDVLAGAPDIEYDQATEGLCTIMKKHNKQGEFDGLQKLKPELPRSRESRD